ncbi:MAG: aspartate carbamoyltransferase regulatory subunit [Candidatus Heimdallarchaeum endolithica]|uniref:Aspartate carbamoyltransferase regulatory chain n=1 Tax=Candidatus Heimdallarchaeum endolithica TaxID=2876572 RepID=A0A9Y1FNE5_9ARCH|nr:MAG: aspartate carbamoyltransferase regulatory subunit [Candidatus Heimdallarchaeum endolithica]
METVKEKKLIVTKIKEGTVIDRIPPGKAMKVLHVLGINENYPYTVALAMRVKSKKMQLKDIVKIKGKMLTPEESQKLSLIAPNAVVNIINDYKVEKKIVLEIPEQVSEIIRCLNPNCVTNNREPVSPIFSVVSKEPLILRCKYCDRLLEGQNLSEQL